MVALTVDTRCFIQDVEVNHLVVLKPLLGLIDDDCLALRHFNGHATCRFFVKELTLRLVELFRH